MSTGNYRFVVTQKPFQHLCDACESCYSCEPSPRTGVAPHAFWPHPVSGPLRDGDPAAAGARRRVRGADAGRGRGQPRRRGAGARGLGRRCAGGADVGVRRGGAEVLQAAQRPGVGRAARGPADPARRTARASAGPRRVPPHARVAAAPGRRQQADQRPAATSPATGRSASPGRTASNRPRRTSASRCGPAPTDRGRGGPTSSTTTTTAPTPTARRAARPPGHRPSARRPCGPGTGPCRREGLPAQRHAARRHRARPAEAHGDRSRSDRHQHHRRQRRVALGVRRVGPRGRGGGGR